MGVGLAGAGVLGGEGRVLVGWKEEEERKGEEGFSPRLKIIEIITIKEERSALVESVI
jgi:hypothetical protein